MFTSLTNTSLVSPKAGSPAEPTATTHRRRGRTRIWDDLIAPRPTMTPKKPDNLIDALLDTFLHPVRGMREQVARGTGFEDAPSRLWGLLAFLAVAGSLLYGASLVLALPAGSWSYAALALASSAGLAWVLFGIVLVGITRKPAAHLAHASLVAMMFGEAVLELGVIANFLLRDFAGALALNVAIVALSNIVMLAVLIAQLRVIGIRPATVAALWVGILNTAGLAIFRLFYPELFPF